MADIQNPRLLYLKGALFLVLGALSGTALLLETPSPRHALFLALTVWGFARAYYFAFYVIEHYVDDRTKFAGLWSFLRYVARRERISRTRSEPDRCEPST
jgi:hypothetical protein